MRDNSVVWGAASRSRAVNSSSYQKLCTSRPTNANARPMTQAAPKQAMATRRSASRLMASRPRPISSARARLPVEGKEEPLAHVAALERLAQPPDPGVDHEVGHHGADE